ncbi:glycosyltransferase [Halospeciosus flavus]|uniref:Glycosyltransferase n=1 Tax=Halospeciosus flavus TaxID=3032283 RepID=A0ABD5Z517_9EURY|nr:glycosyltransferase [Halospeciosus flavus]
MRPAVAAFTDTYLPTVNGVTYTIATWREHWEERGGRMDVVFPESEAYTSDAGEHPVGSISFPFYEGFRVGTPTVPDAVRDVDVVHAHTPFAVGMGGYRLARSEDLPLVANYHTPTSEYADYVVPSFGEPLVERVTRRYEKWFLERADLVLTPSEATRDYLADDLDVSTPVEAFPNGVDLERFRPVNPEAFLERHDLIEERPLVGYTGRHGYEKCLEDLVEAAAGLDATIVLGGDGPARDDLETLAAHLDVDARFLGFLDREELPEFYSALDVFAFPSPVETEGLVALEANACGTPVVGVDSGALSETIDDGVNGYHYAPGAVDAFRTQIERALVDEETLAAHCLDRREEIGVERSVDRLEDVYERLL